MSKQANPGLIGLFVIGAVGLMAGAVLLFGSAGWLKQPDQFVTYFEGSVLGLERGSSVFFRGVPVGSVAEVFASVERDALELDVTVILEIDRTAVRDPSNLARTQPIEEVIDILIARGLRTKLIIQSVVAGQLAVNLDFYPDSPAVYRAPPHLEHPEIPSVPSDLQQVQEVAGKLVGRIEDLELEELIATAMRTLDSIERLASSEKIANILAGADTLVNSEDTQQLTGDLRSTIAQLDATLGDARQLLAHTDERMEPLFAKLDPLVEQLGQTLVEAQAIMQGVQDFTSKDSELVYRAMSTLEEMESAMRSMRFFLDYLEQHPEALLRGKAKP